MWVLNWLKFHAPICKLNLLHTILREAGQVLTSYYLLALDMLQVPVPALKEQIASVTGVVSEQQRLICRGKVLKDDQLLSAYRILSIFSWSFLDYPKICILSILWNAFYSVFQLIIRLSFIASKYMYIYMFNKWYTY